MQEAKDATKLVETDLYEHTDDTLVHWLCSCGVPLAEQLARAVKHRKLYKIQFQYGQNSFEEVQSRNYRVNPLSRALDHVQNPDLRKQLEDDIASQIGARRGDVLICPMDRGGNLKPALMNVEWKGEDRCLMDIDDPVIAAKLEATLAAHRMLWAIRVVATPELSEVQKRRLHELCDIHLITPEAETQIRMAGYFEDMIEDALQDADMPLPSTAGDYARRKKDAALALMEIASDPRPFADRLRTTLDRFFRE